MKFLKMELHDPLFCLDDEVRRECGDDSMYNERVEAYWYSRHRFLERGAYPTVSEMVWEG